MGNVYMYVVARDFGFAPNPFHGVCTLATCKPSIRRTAQIGDWVVGMGGSRLKATGKCIFAMKVTGTMRFDEYWSDITYRSKRPARNGSRKTIVGDNIYHTEGGNWLQEDSHHSLPDGTPNHYNVNHDTKTDRVLLSSYFYYFGLAAPQVPETILSRIGYTNVRAHRKLSIAQAQPLIKWFHEEFENSLNQVLSAPFDFHQSAARYSAHSDRIT